MRMIQYVPRMIDTQDNTMMLALWRQGLDTLEIAKRLRLKEWQVHAQLPLVREAARIRERAAS